jgi:protein-L-isoaspartate(D-aspartate) O-methyltransferase
MISHSMETRARLAAQINETLGPFDPRHLEAFIEVPRERFVPPWAPDGADRDAPVPLDRSGLATMSAPHAYLLSYRLLGLSPGDSLVELGTGSGYGAALASAIVGPQGRVWSIEIDPQLALFARDVLSDRSNVTVQKGDAVESAEAWAGARKIVCTFAVKELPESWLGAVPAGGILVAPVGRFEADQKLVRVERIAGQLVGTKHEAVRYVSNRSALT